MPPQMDISGNKLGRALKPVRGSELNTPFKTITKNVFDYRLLYYGIWV